MADRVVTVGISGPAGAGLGGHEAVSNTISHVRVVTSGTRPSSPIEGQVIYETDTNLYMSYNGSSWVPAWDQVISDEILSLSQTDYTFSSIPQGFRDLEFVIHARTDDAAVWDIIDLELNGDSGNEYSWQQAGFVDTAISAGAGSSQANIRIGYVPAASADSERAGQIIGQISDYASSDLDPAVTSTFAALPTTNVNNFRAGSMFGVYYKSNAITQLKVISAPNKFVAKSRFTLKGLV